MHSTVVEAEKVVEYVIRSGTVWVQDERLNQEGCVVVLGGGSALCPRNVRVRIALLRSRKAAE